MREGERVREEPSSHIWVDGTHGESTLEWSGVFPHFFCTLSPALYVPQRFLVYFCKIHLPLSPSIPPLPLFLISTFYFYPIRAPYTHSRLLLLRLKRSQMLLYERQSRSVILFFFQRLLQEVGLFGKKERGAKEESRRVQGSTVRGKAEMYCHISSHIHAQAQTWNHIVPLYTCCIVHPRMLWVITVHDRRDCSYY